MIFRGRRLDLTGTTACASFSFRKTARAVTRLYDLAFQDFGMRSTQFTLLVGIAKTQPTAIGALGELLILDRTTLTRSLRLLEKEGLISISKRSRMRQRFLSLTAKGERVLARSLPAWRKAHGRFVAAVGPQYWGNIRRDLERLTQVALRLEGPQPMQLAQKH